MMRIGNNSQGIWQLLSGRTNTPFSGARRSGAGGRNTLEEELAGLDKAFGKMADETGVKEMISGEFKRLSSKAGSRQTAFADTNKKPQGTDVPQKLMTLAQAWKDAYKVSGSKENGMEKILSMLNGMFGIKNEA